MKTATQREPETIQVILANPANPYLSKSYGTSGMTAQEREQLILEHLPQVRLIARRIHDRLPESVSLDDLVSTGVVGLINAIDRLSAGQNVQLTTYAVYQIRWAILSTPR